MEKDIESVKEIIEIYDNIYDEDYKGVMDYRIDFELRNNIEHLLARNKKLEEDNKQLQAFRDFFIKNDYIAKTELKNDLEHMKNAKARGVKQLLFKKE